MGNMSVWRDYAVRRFVEFARRLNRLRTPMDIVLGAADYYGMPVTNLTALDVFARMGLINTRDFASKCASLECWEIDPECEPWLRRFVPTAQIRIGDSIAAARGACFSRQTYNFIVLDNPPDLFGPEDCFCEHFDLFPAITNFFDDRVVVSFNVIPNLLKACRQGPGQPRFEKWRQRRQSFYGGQDGVLFDAPSLIETYDKRFSAAGYRMVGQVLVPRNQEVAYMGCFLVR